MTNLTQWKEEARAEFDKQFPCIDANCDDNGVSWGVRTGSDGEPEQEQYQCQYCHEQRFPYIGFYEAMADRIHAHTLEEVIEIISKSKTVDEVHGLGKKELTARMQAIVDIKAALDLLEHPTDI